MSRATAADLLEQADRLTRELCASSEEVSQAHWEQFDVTLYRTLYELIGAGRADPEYTASSQNPLLRTLHAYPDPLRLPAGRTFSVEYAAQLMDITRKHLHHQIRRGNLHAVKEGDQRVLPTSTLDRGGRDIAPADPSDPHLIARVAVSLGAFTDLIVENNRSPHGLALDDQDLANTVRRLLAMAAATAQHTVRHCPLDAVDRPLLIARYASTYVDVLDPSPRRAPALDHLAAVTTDGAPTTVNDQLDTALYHWRAAAHREVRRLVPSTEAIASIANQGVRLYAVTHQLVQSLPSAELGGSHDAGNVVRELRDGAASLRAAQEALVGLTSLTTPTHDFVTASRELFATLQHVREMAADNAPALDAPAALASLAHGCALEAELLTAARGTPASLLHCHLLFAPARTLEPALERLHARGKGRFIPVELTDVPDLAWRWETAARRTPEVAAAVRCLELNRDSVGLNHGLELGR